jgi:hypothetical protein
LYENVVIFRVRSYAIALGAALMRVYPSLGLQAIPIDSDVDSRYAEKHPESSRFGAMYSVRMEAAGGRLTRKAFVTDALQKSTLNTRGRL